LHRAADDPKRIAQLRQLVHCPSPAADVAEHTDRGNWHWQHN
jgi:hypothetical protein